MRELLKGVGILLFILTICGVVFVTICFAAYKYRIGKIEQFTYIIIDSQQYIIEELSDIMIYGKYIEFTTKDGNYIHAATYELRK